MNSKEEHFAQVHSKRRLIGWSWVLYYAEGDLSITRNGWAFTKQQAHRNASEVLRALCRGSL